MSSMNVVKIHNWNFLFNVYLNIDKSLLYLEPYLSGFIGLMEITLLNGHLKVMGCLLTPVSCPGDMVTFDTHSLGRKQTQVYVDYW